MSTVIKAADLSHDLPGVAFNFDDMSAKAREYLDGIRAEAGRIVARAHTEAEKIRNQARMEGRRAGQKEIEDVVRKQLVDQMATLQQVVRDVEQAKQAWLAHWEKSGVHVAAAIAQRLIRRELSHKPEITLTLVREALELAGGSSQIRIHMNPSDHRTLGPKVEILVAELAPLGSVELVADPEVGPGGCRVETRFGVIDQQLEAQLARIEEELT